MRRNQLSIPPRVAQARYIVSIGAFTLMRVTNRLQSIVDIQVGLVCCIKVRNAKQYGFPRYQLIQPYIHIPVKFVFSNGWGSDGEGQQKNPNNINYRRYIL